MTPRDLLVVINRSFELLPGKMASDDARRMLIAIAMQESGLKHRYQVLTGGAVGAAKSWWQIEPIACLDVITRASTRAAMATLCQHCSVELHSTSAWRAAEGHDVFAAGVARLILWTDSQPLPSAYEGEEAWEYYLRTWRPGKPHVERWQSSWSTAMQVMP